MMGSGTVWYRGTRFRLGRGQHCYAMWAADGPPDRPVEWWPESPAGWSAAWARFTALEPPGAIVHLSPPTGRPRRAVAAVSLLGAGVLCGVASLFPGYLAGKSLASEPDLLVSHLAYLAVWTASAGLIWSGGQRRWAGALLGLGTSVVTFGFFLSDVGEVVAGGARLLGAGLVLGVLGWLACTAGGALAVQIPAAGAPRWPRRRPWDARLIPAAATLAAVGAACAFAPSWDRYTLRTATGLSQTLTAGNSFANPAAVMAGDFAVMAGLVLVVVIAALWRPARLGAALLAGAVIPMVAEAVTALIEVGEPTSSAQFGIAPAQAARVGLTIGASVTAAFWIYCGFVLVLVLICAWLLWPARRPVPLAGGGYPARPGTDPALGGGPWRSTGDLVPAAADRTGGPAVSTDPPTR
jgi:hypothetical protein